MLCELLRVMLEKFSCHKLKELKLPKSANYALQVLLTSLGYKSWKHADTSRNVVVNS